MNVPRSWKTEETISVFYSCYLLCEKDQSLGIPTPSSVSWWYNLAVEICDIRYKGSHLSLSAQVEQNKQTNEQTKKKR